MGRRIVASLWAAVVAPYVVLSFWVPAARAWGFFALVPIPAVVALSMVAGVGSIALRPRLAMLLPESIDDWFQSPRRPAVALWALSGVVPVISLGRMAVFLGDPSRVGYSLAPWIPFLVHHSCLTAYLHGAILSTDPTANVYDMIYVGTAPDAPLPATAAQFAPFKLDAYGYPPAFLLLPRLLIWLTPDFLSQRMLFSAASLLLAFFACASAARTLGGEAGRRIWLLTPLFLASVPVLATLQVGNFHLAAVALCLLCWVALETRRDALAGTALAVATLAKVFPGLLGVVLLMQRRWRAVGFTVLAAAILCALSVLVLGTQIWRDYLFYELPKVRTGEALRFMADSVREIDFNLSPFGLPFKLDKLGFSGWGWEQARHLGSATTAVLLVLAVLAGRNGGGALHRLTVWLAMVMLGSLQSPFAAPFVLTGLSVLLLALAAETRSWRGGVGILAAWLFWFFPLPFPDPKVTMALSLARALALYVFLVWAVVRREPEAQAKRSGGTRAIAS